MSTLTFFLAVRLRQQQAGVERSAAWSRFAREGGLGILTGGFVSLGALATARALLRIDPKLQSLFPHEPIDGVTLACIVASLLLLAAERGRWAGHQPATVLAALVPWLLVPEWSSGDGALLPAASLGLLSAALYRVLLSGARSERMAASARHAAIEATGDGVVVVDANGVLVDANEKGREAFRDLLLGDDAGASETPAESLRLPDQVRSLLTRPEARHFNLRNSAERVYEIWLGAADALDRGNGNRALVLRDVTDRHHDERRLLRLAHYDSLTGLANRRLFVEELERALREAESRGAMAALLYMDLDRFKEINDTLGHGAGDELLRTVARRVSDSVRSNLPRRLNGPLPPSVARLGGDEFAVILPDATDQRGVEQLAQSLLQSISEPARVGDRKIAGSGSIGIAVYPKDGSDVENLVKHADSALYAAKRLGRNRVERYRPEFSREADRTRAIEQELRGAIARGEFELHYQPKVDVPSQTVAGFEALLRWRCGELGPVAPAEFIPVAEERGLIADIGAWCLQEACQQLRRWLDHGYGAVPVAVNVSSAQFIDSNLQDLVSSALVAHDLDPALLELELTERLLLEDNEQTSRCLADLREIGVRIALDDFGTGYSALTYLNRFPLNVVKMDRDLLLDIDRSDSTEGIVAAVISMSHSLGLRVVAEGVDSEAQLAMLQEMGCDEIQGFVYAPALRASDVARMLAPAGQARPMLEPKTAPRAASEPAAPALEAELELEPAALRTSAPEEADAPASPARGRPRALILDVPEGALESVSARLERLGVELDRAPWSAALERFELPDGGPWDLLVATPDSELAGARETLERISGADLDRRPSLLVVGDEPDANGRVEIRRAGARWVLWAPFDDAELRFLVGSATPHTTDSKTRYDTRIPMDAMAWIRCGARREVGLLSSLSSRGAFIEMGEPPEQGSSLRLEFELPSGRVTTFAKVAYTHEPQDESDTVLGTGVGVTFYGLNPSSQFAIRELVEAVSAKYLP